MDHFSINLDASKYGCIAIGPEICEGPVGGMPTRMCRFADPCGIGPDPD